MSWTRRLRALGRRVPGPRLLVVKWLRLSRTVDHAGIVRQVDEDGSLRASYLFMCVMASGIATTGLLVNSPAVIIGAMLISPLMSPIMRLGLGIGTLDGRRARGALQVLAGGMAFALATSAAIVLLSPIRELTPEILARTRPTLFDLVIAALSGLAGGYAMVRGRGGAIVGVAIATALMPPMAVVGYGLASAQWPVARGAALLFTTNLFAIALCVTAICTWYGFSRHRLHNAIAWQTALTILLVLPVAVPLQASLRRIAYESATATQVRAAVARVLGADESRVLALHIDAGGRGAPTRIELTIAAHHYSQHDDRRLRDALLALEPGPVELRLSPIIEADPARTSLVDAAIANAQRDAAREMAPPQADSSLGDVLAAFPIPLSGYRLDQASRHVRILPAASGLAESRALQQAMRTRFPDWRVEVVPPAQPLPLVAFADERDGLAIGPAGEATLDTIAWGLHAWSVTSVRVYGHASTEGSRNDRLALERATLVADRLRALGFVATPVATAPEEGQRAAEVARGRLAFRFAEVVPVATTAISPSIPASLPAHAAPEAP
jgi:uncharacterized hydrophobic protein (TIGR00271 family)